MATGPGSGKKNPKILAGAKLNKARDSAATAFDIVDKSSGMDIDEEYSGGTAAQQEAVR